MARVARVGIIDRQSLKDEVMRKIAIYGLSLVFVLASYAAQAQLASGHLSPQDGTFTFRGSDGALFVADVSTQRIYVSAPSGALSEIAFQDAVASAEPDPSKRQALLAAFNIALSNPSSAGLLQCQPSRPLLRHARTMEPTPAGGRQSAI